MIKTRMPIYLGDSVFAESDGYNISLFLSNWPGEKKNIIILEPNTLKEFIEFIEAVTE